ncbi:lysophospholipid acyltransferase family protein [Chloroflexota bacterium]
MHWLYYVARFLVKVSLLLFTRWQVVGRENVPEQGALLIVANHINITDPPVLGMGLGRKVMFMAKEELFRSKFQGYFLRKCGVFPVKRGQFDRAAFRHSRQLLAQGWALVMFPEGGRSRNARLQTALSGSALVALRAGVPILSAGITGTESIKGIGWLFRRPRITVNIGYPFFLPPVNGRLTKVELAELTHSIMEHIAELLPVEYRGNYDRQKISERKN